ncbi:hypothetical protein, partial [uncultured Alistipes sp.]|uniref:hypothetical protein n=1 Tax=uncultured Alistipes sp. TaxID=538949 RepID=UPI0026E94BA8
MTKRITNYFSVNCKFFYNSVYEKCRVFPSTLHKTQSILKAAVFEIVANPIWDGSSLFRSFHILRAPVFETGRHLFDLIDTCFGFGPKFSVVHQYWNNVASAVRVPRNEFEPLWVFTGKGRADGTRVIAARPL